MGYRVAESFQFTVNGLQFVVLLGQAFVKLADLAFGGAAFGSVPNGAENQLAIGCLNRAQADFNGQMASILTSCIQTEPQAHRTGFGLHHVATAVLYVALGKVCRNKHFHFLANQFLLRIVEHDSSLLVCQGDIAVGIGDDDGIRCRFNHRAKHLFITCHTLFSGSALGDGTGQQQREHGEQEDDEGCSLPENPAGVLAGAQ